MVPNVHSKLFLEANAVSRFSRVPRILFTHGSDMILIDKRSYNSMMVNTPQFMLQKILFNTFPEDSRRKKIYEQNELEL